MSRAFREFLERQYPFLQAFNDSYDGRLRREEADRQQADQGMREWYEDQAAQDEYNSWLRTLEEQQGR